MAAPIITELPEPPVRSDAPVDFALKADLFLGAFPWLREQINTTATWVDGQAGAVATNAASAANDAGTASAAGTAAIAAAGTATAQANIANAAATAANNAKTAAEAAAERAEDAAQYVEGVVGPLGSAATRDVTTSATDTTTGRVMKVGDGGLLSTSGGGDVSPNSINSTQFFRAYNSSEMPTLGVYSGLHIQREPGGRAVRLLFDIDGLGAHVQWKSAAGVWGTRVFLHNSGNQLGLGTTAKSARNAIKTWEIEEKVTVIQDATGTVDIDLSQASAFAVTLTGNVTLNPINLPQLAQNETRSIVVSVSQGATAYMISWWGGIMWLKSTPLTLPAANKVREYVLTYGGGFWVGREGAGT